MGIGRFYDALSRLVSKAADTRRWLRTMPPTPYSRAASASGWILKNRGWHLISCVAWVLPALAVEKCLADAALPEHFYHPGDAVMGRWACEQGLDVYYHVPSLVQHIGLGNSALGDTSVLPLRVAADFIGEAASALGLREQGCFEEASPKGSNVNCQ